MKTWWTRNKLVVANVCLILVLASGVLVWSALAANPDLLVSSSGGGILRYERLTGAFLGAFVAAGSGGLGEPRGLVFGPDGNLYVSSLSTSQVLRYNGQTGAFIAAFVTAGSGGLVIPNGLVFGPDGNLYVTSSNTSEVLR
jgi:DNA-binding beta-propeller fold protein YncE